ncbi:hypothetical protein BaRGS_00007197 [Batillaria attramentaria]|uniref:Uncharacterized protein n=1 Tax=Batillaria attramentaria TaxID=370345 RepID=A0ABD0LRG8_9CAEN
MVRFKLSRISFFVSESRSIIRFDRVTQCVLSLSFVLQMSSFEHMEHGCHGSPPHSEIMMQAGYHHLPHDDMPNSVGSDFPGTPSELSSPLSQ